MKAMVARPATPKHPPGKAQTPATQGKRIVFDQDTFQALDLMAREKMATFQELADEAFRDLLKKHGRPLDVRDALKKSARAARQPAGDDQRAADRPARAAKRARKRS